MAHSNQLKTIAKLYLIVLRPSANCEKFKLQINVSWRISGCTRGVGFFSMGEKIVRVLNFVQLRLKSQRNRVPTTNPVFKKGLKLINYSSKKPRSNLAIKIIFKHSFKKCVFECDFICILRPTSSSCQIGVVQEWDVYCILYSLGKISGNCFQD